MAVGVANPGLARPDLLADFAHMIAFDGALLDSWVYVVFPAGVPNGHDFVASKYFGFTRYELTGYFSGRLVNFYGWAAAQNGVHEDSPIGGEQEGDRQARYAEFCVEDWCYRPDPDPVRHKQVMSPSEVAADRAEYAQIVTEMRRAGAKRCGNPQQGHRSGKPETQL
ncbi:MAG TPA: hypothetical protein VER12_04980 [Polyangiaceae bacterium]|nr:hypothetical protein [Polyangiaceae bacterium]